MHIHLSQANFTPKPRFQSVNLYLSKYFKRSKAEKNTHSKTTLTCQRFEGILYKQGLVVNFELVTSSCLLPPVKVMIIRRYMESMAKRHEKHRNFYTVNSV